MLKVSSCIVACAVGVVIAQAAVADSSAGERLASLSIPGIKWGAGHELELTGVPAYARPFSSHETAVHVARSLALQTDIFQHALSLPNKFVLSGLDQNWHWLAQIESTPAGAKGQVSALRTGPLAPRKSERAGFTWLPVHAARQFSHRMHSAAGAVEQHVYTVAVAPAELTVYLRRQLRAEGWVAEPLLAATRHHSAWRRNDARLMVFPQQSPGGSSLYIHHVE